ncbi:MAG: allophanate hydrolase [Alphaproteobacteria bacterium]
MTFSDHGRRSLQFGRLRTGNRARDSLGQLPFTIHDIHAAYAAGRAPEEVVTEVYRRIGAVDDPGIFLHLREQDDVHADAGDLGDFDPARKPLWGIPFAIKDNVNAAGMPTTVACPAFAYTAEDDAFVLKLLRTAGALLIGKTNMDQFATGLVGVRTPYPVPRNALDPEIVPGGSSSGSAVAVAQGLVCFSLGSDAAGSGRVPAALNNIVGLKPSSGILSSSGTVPAVRSLDTLSVFALSVEDATAAFRTMAVYDPLDAFSRNLKVQDRETPAPTIRMGIPSRESREFFDDQYQEVAFDVALRDLRDLGVELVELDFAPFYAIARMLYEGAWLAERYALIESLLASNPDAIYPVTRQIISAAASYSAVDVFRDFYKLSELKMTVRPQMQDVDMLCVPSIPTFYSCADLAADPIGPNSRLGTYTNFVNLMDMCGIAVPVRPRVDGRPSSVTILAGSGEDHWVASVASVLHRHVCPTLGAMEWELPRSV